MKKTRILAVSLVALVAAGLVAAPATADAQYRRRGHAMAARQDWIVRPLVTRTERESNAFRAWFEHSPDRNDAGQKANVQRLDEALERLRAKADDHKPGIGREDLQTALRYGRLVNRRIYRNDTRHTVREWTDLRGTLNELSRLYGLRRV